MKRHQAIISGILLAALTACSQQAPLGLRAPQSANLTRFNSEPGSAQPAKALFKAPGGQLRQYASQQASQLKAQSQRGLRKLSEPDMRVSPIVGEAPPEPPVTQPNSPDQPAPTDPAAPGNGLPTAPSSPQLPGEQPNAPITQPNAPGSPGNGVPSGGQRYEDLQWFLRKIEAPRAWRVTQGNPKLTVAVIDTGVDYDHPAFRDRILKGYDYAEGDMDPTDDLGHGTHVAGIIAGNDGNIKGVAPNVNLLAIKVFSKSGFTQDEFALSRAIRYATKYGASVINLSLGSPTLFDCGQYSDYIRALNSAIDEAISMGVTVITAAGNETYDFIYGRCSVQQNVNQIPVVATNEMDRLAPFSNYPNFTHPKAVSAPGVNIFSTVPRHLVCDEYQCGMPYDFMDGTSMSSPVIAGAIALVRSAMYEDYVRTLQRRASRGMQMPILSFRDFFHERALMAQSQLSLSVSPAQLAERIVFSHTNQESRVIPPALIYEGRRDPLFGYGRINVGAATEAASIVFSAAGL